MFKKLFFAVLVLMLVLGLAGCSDDDTPATSSADSSSSGSVSSGAVSSSGSVSSGAESSSGSVSSGAVSSSGSVSSGAVSSSASVSSGTVSSSGSVSSGAVSSSSSVTGGYSVSCTETFETLSISSYTTDPIVLDNGYTWQVTRGYPESSSTAHGGSKALRIDDDTAEAGLVSPAMNGLGTISFWYRTLNSEATASTFKVQVSVDNGAWSDVGSGTFQGQEYQQFTATVNNSAQNLRFRILSDNQPGHMILDDIQWTTDGVTGGSGISSSSAASSTASSQSSSMASSQSSSAVSSSASSISVAAAPAWITAFTGEADGQGTTILDGGKGWINLYISSVADLNSLGSWKLRCGNYKYINDLLSSSQLPAGWVLQDGDIIRVHQSGYTGTTDSAKGENNSQFWDITSSSTYFADSAYGIIWLEDGSGNVVNIVAYTTDKNSSSYWLDSAEANPLAKLQFAVSAGLWDSDQLSGAILLSPYASKLARLKSSGSAGATGSDWETADVLVDDNDNPTVSISSPSDGAGVTSYTVSLTGTASDATSGVASVQVKVDSGAWESASGTTSWSFTTSMLTEGSHVIAVRSLDNGGNISTEESVTVTITHPADNDNPTVTISSPASGVTVDDLTPTISGTAADPGATASGVASVQVRVDGGSWQTATGTTSWSFTPSGDLSEATHTFEVKAVDNKGNESTVSSITITVSAPSGFTKDSSLPQAVQDYYNNAYGKTGAALKTALQTIIRTGHQSVGYSGLYTLYATSDVRSDGKIWDMYSTHADGTSHDGEYGVLGNATYFTATKTYYSFNVGDTGASSAIEGGDGYNREHSWPKSNFGGSTSDDPGTDAHHVVPTDVKVNGWRSAYPYGEVDSSAPYSVNGSRCGSARSGLGYSGTVFEPIDAYKGDFARMHLYMAVRYYNDSKFLDGAWSSAGAKLKPWYAAMLLEWHRNDPVSQKEIVRNNAIHSQQGNRNPFIDYPDAVDLIDFTQ